MKNAPRLAALWSLLLASFAALAQPAPAVLGEPALGAGEVPAARLRLSGKPPVRHLRLAAPTEEDLESVRARNARAGADERVMLKRVAVGLARGTSSAAVDGTLEWKDVEGGRAARLSVTSPQALALRAALDLAGVPTQVEMVFFGSKDPRRLFGPYRVGDIADRSRAWWSPMTEGETLTVELFVPRRGALGGASPRIVDAGHLFANPIERAADKRLQDIGASGACNVDVPCSPLNANAAFRNLVAAVAQMVFNDGSFLYLCTGTLLNDMDASTQQPWFFSANHCFDNDSPPYKTVAQLQAVASTLTTLWFFEASACGAASPNANWQQVGGGATYLVSSPQSDLLFLRLNAPPPAGAFYAGWDAGAVAVGTAAIDVHHPQGDLKKVTQGSVVGFGRWDSSSTPDQYVEIRWTSGTTEGGSSGSGFFTLAGPQYVLRGGLRGGSALCSNPQGTDLFSRFDQAYPLLSPYLGAAATIVPFANVTALWSAPSEPGWALNLIHRPGSNIIFGTWNTYGTDGKRTWLVMPSGTWTSPTTYSGTLYTTTGPRFDMPYDPTLTTITPVGNGTLSFSDANHGTWTYTVNGVAGARNIQRFEF
jgi:hypothetical protein